MAIYIEGKSECLICGKVIEVTDDVSAFPAFLKNTHRLGLFSDGVFHRACFEASPDREEVKRLSSRFRQIWAIRPRDLKTVEEMEAWGRSAFADFP